ncbi:MAG: hypothetical protein EOP14_03540 [Pseudomonas sp.]|nr:MAG: hypothetical protein EOP14_03540 [Pseudomonas sp.]
MCLPMAHDAAMRINPHRYSTRLIVHPNVPYTSHPIAWYHGFEGGRAWYSGLGHFDFVWTNPLFEKHLFGGLLYASGVTNVTP